MKLLNVFLLLLLAFSSLFSSPTAICVPRNNSELGSLIPQQSLSSQSPSSAPSTSDQSESPIASALSDPELNFQAVAGDYSMSESPSGSPSESPIGLTDSGSGSETEPAISFEKLHTDAVGEEPLPPSSTSSTTDLGEICDVTSNPKLCKNSISTNIEAPMNPTSALKTEIEESIKQVEKAVVTLKTLRKDNASSKMEIGVYDTCLENFDLAIFDLKSGLESIDAKDTGSMESNLAAVMSNLVTCDDTFIEMGIDSPLDNLSTKMQKYASNCLAISKLLL